MTHKDNGLGFTVRVGF